MTFLCTLLLAATSAAQTEPDAPALDHPMVVAARNAMAKGDLKQALALLSPLPPAPHVRYLRAIAAARLGGNHLGPASEELELLSVNYPPLADRAAYEGGLVYEQRQLPGEALALYAKVSDASYVFAPARTAMARLEKARGNYKAADAALRPILELPVPRQVRTRTLLALAELAKLRKDGKAEKSALEQLAAIGAYWARMVGFKLGSPAVAMVAKADALLDRGACRSAETVAKKVLGAPDSLGCSARIIAAEAASCRGDDATDELKKIVKDCKKLPELTARALMTLGGMQAKQGHPEAAVAAFRQVAALEGSPLAADASFAAFWVGWKTKADEADESDLQKIEAATPLVLSAQDRARARYWRARVAEEHGDKASAVALLQDVARLHPATWYARLARQRLAELDAAALKVVALPAVLPMEDEPLEAQPGELLPGIVAVKLGLDGGPEELTALGRRFASPEVNRVVAETLLAANETYAAHRFARSVLREHLGGEKHSAAIWRAGFPTPFSEAISKNSEDSSVPPGLLQALVREESAFNPSAKSHVGALGLTQLMPITARALARERGKPLEALTELLDPARNLELGAAYLGQMLRRFDNEGALAAAAYNGGPTRVARWLKLRPCERLEEWVEEIPIDETRNYVKDVLASADVYKQWPTGLQTASLERALPPQAVAAQP